MLSNTSYSLDLGFGTVVRHREPSGEWRFTSPSLKLSTNSHWVATANQSLHWVCVGVGEGKIIISQWQVLQITSKWKVNETHMNTQVSRGMLVFSELLSLSSVVLFTRTFPPGRLAIVTHGPTQISRIIPSAIDSPCPSWRIVKHII